MLNYFNEEEIYAIYKRNMVSIEDEEFDFDVDSATQEIFEEMVQRVESEIIDRLTLICEYIDEEILTQNISEYIEIDSEVLYYYDFSEYEEDKNKEPD